MAQKSSLINRLLIKSADFIFVLISLILLEKQGLGEESLGIDFRVLGSRLAIVVSRCALGARNWSRGVKLALSFDFLGRLS